MCRKYRIENIPSHIHPGLVDLQKAETTKVTINKIFQISLIINYNNNTNSNDNDNKMICLAGRRGLPEIWQSVREQSDQFYLLP